MSISSDSKEVSLPLEGYMIVRLLGGVYLLITYDRASFKSYAEGRNLRSAQVYSAPYIYVVEDRNGVPEGSP